MFKRIENNSLPVEFGLKSIDRPGSFPFISGDTFRSWCDFSIEPGGIQTSIYDLPKLTTSSRIFIKVDIFLNPKYFNSIINLLKMYSFAPCEGPTVIVHNGDFPPNRSQLEEIAAYGADVYCVNIVSETEFIHSVPIGLENAHFQKSGEISHFIKNDKPIREQTSKENKNNLIFSAFNAKTNVAERKRLIKLLGDSRHSFLGSSLSPEDFRLQIQQSFFVLSPQGNGLDCHRTWESIYLGAVPVVISGTLSPFFTQNLPIWEIEKWEIILEMTDSQLKEKYEEINSRDPEMAYSAYWENRFTK